MNERFKIKATIQELMGEEELWNVLTLNTITAVKSEADGLRIAQMLEDAMGSDGGGTLHAHISIMMKAHSGNMLILLGRFFEGGSFEKKEFVEAVAYNYDILNDILLNVLGSKERFKKALFSAMGSSIPTVLTEMLARKAEKALDEKPPKERVH